MDCKEVLFRLWEYLDQELGPEEAAAVSAHLTDCMKCYPAYRCDQAFLDLVARQQKLCSAPAALRVSIQMQLRLY